MKRQDDMKLTVDTQKCSGHARCFAVAPDVFDLDDSGYALPLDKEVSDPLDADIAAGISACPERAISVH
jgi:ferredoxin